MPSRLFSFRFLAALLLFYTNTGVAFAGPVIDLAGDWKDLFPVYSGDAYAKGKDSQHGALHQISRVAAGPDGASYVFCNRMHGKAGLRTSVATLIKYGPKGTKLWQKNIDGEFGSVGTDAKVDADGNVYVTGWVQFRKDGSVGARGYALCISSEGKQRWEYFAHKPMARVTSRYLSLALHGASVYLTGDFSGQPNKQPKPVSSLLVTRLSMTGKRQWTREFDSKDRERRTSGFGIAVSPRGMICVLGNYDYSALPRDRNGDVTNGYAMALDPQGKQLWVTAVGQSMYPAGVPRGQIASYAFDVVVDEAGSFYVLGDVGTKVGNRQIPRAAQNGLGGFVTKLSPRGKTEWTTRLPKTSESRGFTARFKALRIGYGPDKSLWLFGRGKEEPGMLRCDTQGKMKDITYYAKTSRCKAADFDFLADGALVMHGTIDFTPGRLFGQKPPDKPAKGPLAAEPHYFILKVGLPQ